MIVEVEKSDSEDANVAYGEVYAQTPKAGNRVEEGTTITIKFVQKELLLPLEQPQTEPK